MTSTRACSRNTRIASTLSALLLPFTLGVLISALPGTPGGASMLSAQAANERPVRGEGAEARHPEAAKAIDQIKSPYCPGMMLEVCPSPGGQALRDSLQMLAEDGRTAEQIVEWVVANHGEEYRALPKRSGASLILAWIVPPVVVFGGLAAVIVALRSMRAGRPPRDPIRDDLSPEEEARLREAVEEMDAEEEATFF
jgi:cytochrome c-type biogenesis protein CcmH/NrfF